MQIGRWALTVAVVFGAALGSVSAQIIGPVPPATPPTPPYTPPAPPPPPVPQPVDSSAHASQPEERLPTIVRRTRDGKFIPIREFTPEEAAFRAFPYSEEEWKKLDAVIDIRDREIDRFVAQNVPDVMAARQRAYSMDEITEFAHLPPIRDLGLKLSQGSVVDRLIRDGALPFAQRRKIDAMVKEYNDALRKAWEEEFGNDPLKVAIQIGKEAFLNNVREVIYSLDRSIRFAAPSFGRFMRGAGLTPDQEKALGLAEAELATMKGTQPQDEMQRLGLMKQFFLEILTIEQQERFIKAVEEARAAAEAAKQQEGR